MSKVYVPIGCCCGPSIHMKEIGKRTVSFPLDWLCSYHNVHKIFASEFFNFLDTYKSTSPFNHRMGLPKNEKLEYSKKYAVRIFHREYEEQKGTKYEETIQRRIDRLLNIMRESKDEIVFIRRGHMHQHHNEVLYGPLPKLESSIGEKEDMEKLVEVLTKKYPDLKFKIHLFIDCNCRKYKDSESEHLSVKVVKQVRNDTLFTEELKKL